MVSIVLRKSKIHLPLFDQILVSGTNFLTTIIIARYLGLVEFGRFSLIWMIVLFIGGIQTALIISPMMSIGPKTNKNSSEYYGAVFTQYLVLSAALIVILFIVLRLTSVLFPEWHIDDLLIEIIITVFFFHSQDFFRRYFYTKRRYQEALINDAISCIGRIILLFLLLTVTEPTVKMVLLSIAGSSALACLIGWLKVEKLIFIPSVFRSSTLRHWKMSKWLAGASILQWLAGNIYVLVAAAIIGSSAAGIFKAMQNLIGVLNVLFGALENVITVNAAKIYSENKISILYAYLKTATQKSGVLVLLFFLMVILMPEFWLVFFYGDKYAEYSNLLTVYSVMALLTFANLIFRIALRTLERTKPIYTSYFMAAIFAFLSAYPLVHFIGLYGLVLGLITVQVIMMAYYIQVFRKRI